MPGDDTIQITKASGPEPERAKERRTQGRVSLLVYHREGAHIVPLHPGESVVVGRMAPSDVTVNDVSLSRQHARFTLMEGGHVAVEDLGSTNGTQVAGQTIERARIAPGDEVMLGAVTVTLHELLNERMPPSSRDLAGHEGFRAGLEAEVVRARFFSRRLAVVLVRSTGGAHAHVRFWMPRVEAVLRPVDRVGLYSDDAIHILMPEAAAKQASELAKSLVYAPPDQVQLVAGIAIYPDSATHAEELLGESRAAAQRGSAAHPIHVAAEQEPRTILRESGGVSGGTPIVAESPAMQQLLQTASRVAKGAVPVLLVGETGTGKEVLSRYIHEQSARSDKPLVCVNCAAIPQQLVESTLFGHEKGAFTGAAAQQKGVFEAADGGSVFLDEIGELPGPVQAALLRVLETKRFTRVGSTKEITVDVRVIAATHRDLESMVEERRFRQDLLFRLNTITLRIPPLRERADDIPALAQWFLEQANKANAGSVRAVDPAAAELLRVYSWPGNVRELKNAIERAVVIAQGDTLTVDDLPERVRAMSMAPPPLPRFGEPDDGTSELSHAVSQLSGDFRTRMERLEVELLTSALKEAGWNQTEAARQLSMPLRTLVYKIRVHNIRRPDAARRRGSIPG